MKHAGQRNVPHPDPDGEKRIVRRRKDLRMHRVGGGPRADPNRPPSPPPDKLL